MFVFEVAYDLRSLEHPCYLFDHENLLGVESAFVMNHCCFHFCIELASYFAYFKCSSGFS